MARDVSLAIAPEIAGPGNLATAPVQSDTFTGAPKPLLDNNAANLASSLGYFNSKLEGYHSALVAEEHRKSERDRELEKLMKEQALARYDRYKASQSSADLLSQIRAGELEWFHDPFLEDAVKKDRARLLAGEMSQKLDDDILSGKVQLGSPEYNPEQDILKRTAPYLDELDDDKSSSYFLEHLNHIKDGVIDKHKEARGKAWVNQSENMALNSIKDRVNSGIEAGLTGKTLNDHVRKSLEEVGPRIGGGALDLSYQRFDEITLDVYKEAAKDPAKAAQVAAALDAERTGLHGEPIGSLSSVKRNNAAVLAIRAEATKTMQAAEKATIMAQAEKDATDRFVRGDSSFQGMRDQFVTGQTGVEVEVKKGAIQDRVASNALTAIRAQNGGKPDYPRELDLYMRNGLQHPELTATIEGGYAGSGGTQLKSPADATPTQIEAIKQGAAAYRMAHDTNAAYTGKNVTKNAQGFYEAYDILTRKLGYSEDMAAAKIAYAYSKSGDPENDPNLSTFYRELPDAVKSIDFNEWYKWGGGAVNQGQVAREIREMAGVIGKTQDIRAKDAVAAATEALKKRAVFVNGSALLGSNLQKEDVPHVQTQLGAIYDAHKDAMEAQGIHSAADLTIADTPNGYVIMKADRSEFVEIPTMQDGKVVKLDALRIGHDQVMRIRNAAKAQADQKAADDIVSRQKAADEKFREDYGLNEAERAENAGKRARKAASDAAAGAAGYVGNLFKKAHEKGVQNAKELTDDVSKATSGYQSTTDPQFIEDRRKGAKKSREAIGGFIKGLTGN